MIYLDNAAATPVDDAIMAFFGKASIDYFANQEAAHRLGYECGKALKQAERSVIKLSTGHDDGCGVFWTAGGSDALALTLRCLEMSGKVVVTTQAEHAALSEGCGRCFETVRLVRLKADGRIDLDQLAESLDEDVGLVAIHHVNSETGVIQPLGEIRELIDEFCPDALFLADTIQSAGKIKIPWKEAKLDMIFVSGYKIGAPSGGFVLYRIGTTGKLAKKLENLRTKDHCLTRISVPVALTLVEALERASEYDWTAIQELNHDLRRRIDGFVMPNGKKIKLTIDEELASPFITHITLPGYQGEVVTRMLSDKDIHVAPGSACEAAAKTPSRVLTAMGMKRADAYSALRISLWRQNTADDIALFCETLRDVLIDY